ncbi:polyphosphate polymerase domain-containing protein [Acetobacterium tundrae]|uniref:VTC domain-containing protein n=1 Tax=Acetobacterium tundrae TaxID=132932 RepID=A0ABR6WKF4_9FIRM|nr:polyphosphate polymerase domain-containing protein [Acetobacterium tundrae]MBC3796998.1 VTC domain-containing protein [Acetobacterium tundrae]
MITTTFKRYEKKYQIHEFQLKELMPILLAEMMPDDFTLKNNGYSIYNIYFDTENYDIIRHSLSKPYYKEKLRLRSYAIPISSDDKVFLELKKKIGGIVSKRRATMTLNEANRFISKREYPLEANAINRLVLEEIDNFLDHHVIEPKAYISYDRIAFVGKNDPEFRVTFDCNIKNRQNNLSLEEGDFGNQLLPKDGYIMEIKILGAIPVWLTHALSSLKIYSSSFSKYGNAYTEYRRQGMAKIINMPISDNTELKYYFSN